VDGLEAAFLADEGWVVGRWKAAVEPVGIDVAVEPGEADGEEENDRRRYRDEREQPPGSGCDGWFLNADQPEPVVRRRR